MIEFENKTITSPEGVAKLHTFVTQDVTGYVLKEGQYKLFLEAHKIKPEGVIGEFKEPGWYYIHSLEEKTLARMVPDYKTDVAAIMGLMSLCILNRDWMFSISLGKNSPVVVDTVYYTDSKPRRTMAGTLGDALLGSIYLGLALEMNSDEEQARGEIWLQ